MENLITCSICLRKFDDPRVLPCQHTFCLKPCLEKLYDINLRHIKCPLCRVVHVIQKGNIRTLPKNFTIQSLIDMPSEKHCQICLLKANTLKNCECCTKEICDKCYDTHLEKTKADLMQLNRKLKQSFDRENQLYLKICNEKSCVDNEKQKLISAISQSFEEINSLMQQRRADLIGQVNGRYEVVLGKLKQVEEIKEIDVAVLSSSLQAVSTSIGKGSSSSQTQGHLLALLNSIQTTMPAADSPNGERAAKPQDTPSARFTWDSSALKKSLAEFGELRWLSEGVTDVCARSDDGGGSADNTQPRSPDRQLRISKECVNANGDSGTNVMLVPMSREKTFLLNRLPKPISFDILIQDKIVKKNSKKDTSESVNFEQRKKNQKI